jgi:hypothetical protein
MTNKIEQLIAALPSLSANSQAFAQSLINQSRTRTLSDKQMFYVDKMLRDVAKPAAPTAEIGSMDAVVAMFDRFAERKANPSVVLILASHEEDGRVVVDEEVRVSRYGAQSKYVGQIKVASHTHFEDGQFGPQGRWYGTITKEGEFKGNRRHAEVFGGIAKLMTTFCAAPAKTATEHGKLMARCVFCYKSLSAEDSAGVGYGATCAKKHGMPYGKEATATAVAEDMGVA